MKALDWRSLISIASRANEEEKRRLLLDGIYHVVENWQGPLPDLLEIFRPEKIECLLSYAVTDQEGVEEARIRFIKFVVDSGYRDQPKIGTDGRYVLRRTTPIHLVLRAKIDNWDATATNMVQLLFEIYDRFDLNYTDEGGFTHFQAACFIPNGHQLVRKFLQNGQNPNFFVNGYSLLRSALQNDTKWARELLIRGADPTCVDTDGSTSLHTICRDGRVELLQSFFEVVDYHRKPVQINVRDSLGNTPLHLAVESGNVTTFELLLTRGADVNSVNEEGSTPLHLICQRVKKDKLIASFFKVTDENRQTVQVNVRDKKGNTPLYLTLKNSNTWASEILLKRGADVNSVNEEGSTPLHIICQQLQADLLVETFLHINARLGKMVQINTQDKGLNTPLHLAILHCKKKASAILLSRGADPNLADKDGCTAMHLELSKIHQLSTFKNNNSIKIYFEICDSVNKTVNIDAQDNEGRTLLYAALEYKNSKAVELLLRRGANPDLANNNGSTPLHLICQRNKNTDEYLVEFMRILHIIGKSVNIHARDKTGRTPLSVALLNGNTKMAEWLLGTGADPNLADKTGWTPLHIICTRCTTFLIKFLKIIENRKLPVEFNAKTVEGRTPLKLLRDYQAMNYNKYSPVLEKLGARLD